MNQLNLLSDPRAPVSINWNLWHGCTKISEGCRNCYMFGRDRSVGRDPSQVMKTGIFDLPVQILRSGTYKGLYRIPTGSRIFTCFSSDFFHPAADDWRNEAWEIIKERSDCTFFMITKRPERIAAHLPHDWNSGWEHVTIAVTCENQHTADKRLPIYLSLPLYHHSVMIEPMLTSIDLRPYFSAYRTMSEKCVIELVSVGGESGPDARPCNYDWVLDLNSQCNEYRVSFHYHQTGAKLIKDGKLYNIPRKLQHSQARKAALDLTF